MSNLSELLPAGSSVKSADFVAQGTLASGVTVALRSDGKVEAVAGVTENVGSSTQISTGNFAYPVGVYDTTNDKVVVLYSGPSNRAYAVVGDVSGTSISFGSEVEAVNDTCYYQAGAFDSNTGKVLLCYADYSNGEIGNAVVGTVSGTSISFGSVTTFNTASTSYISAIYDPSAQKIVIGYKDSSSGGRLIAATISGTSVSFGSEYNFNSGTTNFISLSYDSSQNKILVFYQDGGNSRYPTCIVASLSGTAFSFGSEVILVSRATENHGSSYIANGKHLLVYRNDGSPNNLSSVVIATVSGTSVSFGTETATTVRFSTAPYVPVVYDSLANKVIIFGRNQDNSYYPTYLVATISGTAITLDSPVVVQSVTSYEQAACYDPDEQKSVFFWPTSSRNIPVGAVFTVGSTNATSFVGITDQAISSAATGKVVCKGGAITNTGLLPLAETFGSKVVFEAAISNQRSSAFDSANNKIVIAYQDSGNSNYGTAIVGTVSGDSITFGTPAVFASHSMQYSSTVYDPDTQKIIISYRNSTSGSSGLAVVGTVSGTSISFGTAVEYAASSVFIQEAVYDTANNKVVITYDDTTQNATRSIVGTVSGTSISFGTAVSVNSNRGSDVSAAYDSANGKIVVAYKESSRGKARVGTVSGTSISFGGETNFSSGNLFWPTVVYDVQNEKTLIAFRDSDNSDYGTAVVGTVSGTSISFGSATVFNTGITQSIQGTYDSTNNVVALSYADNPNSNQGTAINGTISGTSVSFGSATVFNTTDSSGDPGAVISYDTNAKKLVYAFADSGNSNYGTAIVGNLSNALTPNTAYFVQDDGTISTSSTSTKAGTALSTTSLLLTG